MKQSDFLKEMAKTMKRAPAQIRPIREPTLEELEEGLAIDEHGLVETCQLHPDLFYRVAKMLAILTSQRDEQKKVKEEIEARVDNEIRVDARVSEEKITEKEIESQKKLNKKVQDATDRYMQLSAQVGIVSALKESYVQRSYMLKSMVEMTVMSYYDDPQHIRERMNQDRSRRR